MVGGGVVMMTWATAVEASDWTGKQITDEQLVAAHVVIEIYSNVTTDASPVLKPRDRRLLAYAEAYQAAWMAEQVDYTSRTDVDQVSQDGVQYTKGNPDAFTLAPMAKQSLSRLSWRKGRTIQPLTPEQAMLLRGVLQPNMQLAGTEEWLDRYEHWEEMPGGIEGTP